MEILLDVLGGVAGLGLSAWGGYLVGLRTRPLGDAFYWVASASGLALGAALATLGFRYGLSWLWIAGIGFMAGSLTGLKWGSGRIIDLTRLDAARRARDRDDAQAG